MKLAITVLSVLQLNAQKNFEERSEGQQVMERNYLQATGQSTADLTPYSMWHQKETFSSRQNRRISLNRFINFYNVVKPHKGIDNMTPYEKLTGYFYPETVNNAL